MMTQLSFLSSYLLLLLGCSSTSADEVTCTYYQALRRSEAGHELLHLCRINRINYLLPSILMDTNGTEWESGSVDLFVRGVMVNDETNTLDILPNEEPSMELLVYPTDAPRVALLSGPRTTGVHTVLVVRVVDPNGLQPSFSSEVLHNNVFGDPALPNRASFARQYDQCSQGELTFVPAYEEDPNAPGVVDLNITQDVNGAEFTLAFETMLSRTFLNRFTEAEYSTFDHIMFCLPSGMNEEFVAFAILNDVLSFYSDPWCGLMSAPMHEIGHNMGMYHSGLIDAREYDDETCIMGIGYKIQVGPLKCFNGQKFWAFDWFPSQKRLVDRSEIIGQTFTCTLAAFIDVRSTDMNIVYKVGNLYLVYNRARKHNVGVNMSRDQVTVVSAPSPRSTSNLIGSLDLNNNQITVITKFDWVGSLEITIQVCSIDNGAVSYATLAIAIAGTPSLCDSLEIPPTPAPIQQSLGSCGDPGSYGCVFDRDCCDSAVCRSSGTFGNVCIGANASMWSKPSINTSGGGSGMRGMRRTLLQQDEQQSGGRAAGSSSLLRVPVRG